ncbi:MAG: hypothetical protein HXY40_04660 [Chloroflexi bacterium]|nr:hypothetical protein [Chloroflexota bacterium]
MSQDPQRVDRLLDAIEMVKADRREEARHLLRELIRENGDSEHAWLWMSVAVDSLDQSIVCLDNVLRVNPDNLEAVSALYRLRESHMLVEKQRASLKTMRDLSFTIMWTLIIMTLFGVLLTYSLP